MITKQELKKSIGNKLYNALTPEQKQFMLETADSIDFGKEVDLERMFKNLEDN